MGDGSFNDENPYGAQKTSRKSKTLNILAIFLGITVVFAPIGLIIGIVQLVKNKSSEKKGLSIASTAISGVMTLFVVLALVLGSQSPTDTATPETASTQETEETAQTAVEKMPDDKISDVASYDNYTLTLKDASSAIQEDGTNVIYVNAIFKNESVAGTYAYSAFSVKAYQNGEELLDASDINGDEANLIKEVKDGATENVTYAFQLNDASNVEIDICEPTAEANKIGTKTYAVKIETAKADGTDSSNKQADTVNSSEIAKTQTPSSTKNESSAASAAAGAVAGATAQKAVDQQVTAQKEAEQKAAEQKAAEQKATEQKAAEQKAAEQKTAEQKAADEKAATQKAAEQKAAEQKAAEQKAAEQKAAEQQAATAQNTTPSAPVAEGTTYVLNKNTKKFHKPTCTKVETIKSKNRQDYSGDRQTLINQGYQPCKICNP